MAQSLIRRYAVRKLRARIRRIASNASSPMQAGAYGIAVREFTDIRGIQRFSVIYDDGSRGLPARMDCVILREARS